MRSTLLPGWGQLAADRIVLGKVLVLITGLLAIVALTVVLFVEPVEIYAWLADPDVILVIVIANLAVAAMRLFSTGHAWVVAGGHRWFAALILALIVAIPHAAIAWVGLETRDSLMRVFPTDVPLAAASPTTTTTIPSTTTTTVPGTTTTPFQLSPVGSAPPGQYGEDEIDLVDIPPWRPFGEERLNLLLLGGDAGPGRGGLRTDTMIVASIDPVSGDAVLIGLPRNFGGVTLKDGTLLPVRRLNHVYWWGEENPEGFEGPDPAASATREVIENITGLEIDYHMLVDLTGFADLVDAFGGVRVNVPTAVDGPLYDTETGDYVMVRIEAGEQDLNGDRALALARARYGSSDYVRMGRQRCILAAMARDADPLKLFSSLSRLLDVIETNMSTNMPADLLPELVRLAPKVDMSSIRTLGFDPTWRAGRTKDGHAIPDVPRIRDAVQRLIDDPASSAELGASTAKEACS